MMATSIKSETVGGVQISTGVGGELRTRMAVKLGLRLEASIMRPTLVGRGIVGRWR
jgi:hypothetical protein